MMTQDQKFLCAAHIDPADMIELEKLTERGIVAARAEKRLPPDEDIAKAILQHEEYADLMVEPTAAPMDRESAITDLAGALIIAGKERDELREAVELWTGQFWALSEKHTEERHARLTAERLVAFWRLVSVAGWVAGIGWWLG